ncbi:MAG: hypothetical protein ACI8W8_002150 [Rhodothermales bacterium]|jgi:hypothetical protein
MPFECPRCDAANPDESFVCIGCGGSLIVGRLTSQGAGVLGKGRVLEMQARDLTLGRAKDSELVVRSNLIAAQQLNFRYLGHGFSVSEIDGKGNCAINGDPLEGVVCLNDGDRLQVAVEEFSYTDLHPEVLRQSERPSAVDILQLMLGIVTEMQLAGTRQEGYDNALDAVTRIAGTPRAVLYLLDEKGALQQVRARSAAGQPLREPIAHAITRQLLQRIEDGNESVLIIDPTASSIETEHAGIICVPLRAFDPHSGQRGLMGLIYAESNRPPSRLPRHCRPTLQIVAQTLAAHVGRWESQDAVLSRLRNAESAIIVELKSEICELRKTAGQGGDIAPHLDALESISEKLP